MAWLRAPHEAASHHDSRHYSKSISALATQTCNAPMQYTGVLAGLSFLRHHAVHLAHARKPYSQPVPHHGLHVKWQTKLLFMLHAMEQCATAFGMLACRL